MTRAEIKEIAKQVYKEEQDYQQLFKTMLNRTGKDIGSMSDEEKKKFFNAVDKAYKAKSESKLTDKQPINEIAGAYYFYLFVKILLFFFTIIGGFIAKFVNRKIDAEGLEFVVDDLSKNQEFINAAAKLIQKNGNLDAGTSIDISKLPQARESYEKAKQYIYKKYKL